MLSIKTLASRVLPSKLPPVFHLSFVDVEQPEGCGFMGIALERGETADEAIESAKRYAPPGNIEVVATGPIAAALVKPSYIGRVLTFAEADEAAA